MVNARFTKPATAPSAPSPKETQPRQGVTRLQPMKPFAKGALLPPRDEIFVPMI